MKIYACNPDYLREYLLKTESASFIEFEPPPRNSILHTNNNDTATININGMLRDGPSVIADFIGYSYTTYGQILEAIDQIKDNKDIKKVTLFIDSPGGVVAPGVDQVWVALNELRQQKEIIAVNQGIMASGAYWIASAANNIYSVHEFTQQGSIGIYASIRDWTKAKEKDGLNEIRIVSKNAPDKNLPTDDPKLIEQIQEELDYIEQIFLSRIAQGRGLSVDKVADTFGQGSMILTPKAIEVGMLDGYLPNNSNSSSVDSNGAVAATETNNITNNEDHMSLQDLMAQDPSLSAEIEQIKQSAYDDGFKAAQDKIALATKFANNSNYSEYVQTLAAQVIKGEATQEQLDSVVAYEDQLKELSALKAVQEESAELPTTTGEMPNICESSYEQTGKVNTIEDLLASIQKK